MGNEEGATLLLGRPIGRFVEDADSADGLDVRGLRAGDVVTVRTCHSRYRLEMVDPGRSEAQATGTGSFLHEPTGVQLVGSSLTGRGTLVKNGWLLVGYKLVLATPEGELLTSLIREIILNGASLSVSSRVH